MSRARREYPPRLHELGPNGDLGRPVDFDLTEHQPPERRWLALGCGLVLASATLVGLGIWKATELVADAL